MSKMRVPKVNVVRFNESDVIVASGGIRTVTVAGIGDGVSRNATITMNGISYGRSAVVPGTGTTFSSAVNSYVSSDFASNDEVLFKTASKPTNNWNATFFLDSAEEMSFVQKDPDSYNGVYVWNGSQFEWYSQ